jgi:hypothetical protein
MREGPTLYVTASAADDADNSAKATAPPTINRSM